MISLVIYLVIAALVSIAGMIYLREQPERSDANDVFWTIVVSLLWCIFLPLGLVIGACQGISSLINKGKNK